MKCKRDNLVLAMFVVLGLSLVASFNIASLPMGERLNTYFIALLVFVTFGGLLHRVLGAIRDHRIKQ